MLILFLLCFFNTILFEFSIELSLEISVAISILGCFFSIFSIIKDRKNNITYSSVLLFYIISTQLGLVIPYAIFGDVVIENYSKYTMRFLDNPELIDSIYLSNIAILSFAIGRKGVRLSKNQYIQNHKINWDKKSGRVEFLTKLTASCLLGGVGLFFIYHILSGGMQLISTYEVYMKSSAYQSSFYSLILVMYYIGTLYLAASGTLKDNKLLWGIWLGIAVIFALNGNKGEFLYALLAVIGANGVKNKKIKKSMLISIIVLLVFVIPFITQFRNVGMENNFSKIGLNFTAAFVEMGTQIRTNVYLLDDLKRGEQCFLWGKSYYQPIINMVLFFLEGKETATSMIKAKYPTQGFSQVIESYLNFKILGVFLYFWLVATILTKLEIKCKNKLELAYIGSITCILINATRNHFAFVPGQIVLVSVIYIVNKFFVRRSK